MTTWEVYVLLGFGKGSFHYNEIVDLSKKKITLFLKSVMSIYLLFRAVFGKIKVHTSDNIFFAECANFSQKLRNDWGQLKSIYRYDFVLILIKI